MSPHCPTTIASFQRPALNNYLLNFNSSFFIQFGFHSVRKTVSSIHLTSAGSGLYYHQRIVVTLYSEFAVSHRKEFQILFGLQQAHTAWVHGNSWTHIFHVLHLPSFQGVACISGTTLLNFALPLPVISVFGRVYQRNANSQNSHRLSA